jgi:lysophospholipase L1-like esterase
MSLSTRTARLAADVSAQLPTSFTLESWRGNAFDLELGVFDGATVQDLADVSSITCIVRNQSQSGIAMTKTVASADIDNTLDSSSWQDESKQHLTFGFTNSETNVAMGSDLVEYWMVITAIMNDGAERTLAAGCFNLYNDRNNTAGNPPSNPGTSITLEQADARYLQTGDGGAQLTTSETAPVSPDAGDLWLDSTKAKLYTYYNDGDSSQWVSVNSGTATPTAASIGLGNVDNTADAEKPVSTATQTALDEVSADAELKAIFSIPDEGSESDFRHPLARVLLGAGGRHFFMMDQGATGGEKDYNTGNTSTEINTVGNGSISAAWGASRVFDRLSAERFEAPSMVLDGSFWACVGFTFTGSVVNGAIMGQSNITAGGVDWFLQRKSDGSVRFYITREGGSGYIDVISTETLVAGNEYHVAVWYSSVDNEIGISVNGVVKRERAIFGVTSGGTHPLIIGGAKVSSASATNHHNGDIGYAVAGLGEVDYNLINLKNYNSADWESVKDSLGVIHPYGDSLTEDIFVLESERWTVVLSTSLGLNRVVNHGYGGLTSGSILSQQKLSRLKEVRGHLCFVWAGNNDGLTTSGIDQAVENVKKMASNLLYHGARQVMVINCPNRRNWNDSTESINAHSDNLDILNPKIQAVANDLHSARQPVKYVDIWDAFATGNYAPVNANDAADMALRITPRSARDSDTSTSSTHYGALGDAHIAATIEAAI